MHDEQMFGVSIHERLFSLCAVFRVHFDIFTGIIIQQELCATIHRPLKGDGKLHVSAPHRASLCFVALCPNIN